MTSYSTIHGIDAEYCWGSLQLCTFTVPFHFPFHIPVQRLETSGKIIVESQIIVLPKNFHGNQNFTKHEVNWLVCTMKTICKWLEIWILKFQCRVHIVECSSAIPDACIDLHIFLNQWYGLWRYSKIREGEGGVKVVQTPYKFIDYPYLHSPTKLSLHSGVCLLTCN